MNNLDKLYEEAHKISKRRDLISGYSSCGGVGCALITKDNNTYTGICIDCCCGLGFCAEHAAIAEMLKNGESKIVEIVAVSEDGKIVPPCGRCREMILQINSNNKNTVVYLSKVRSEKLTDLLPEHWI